MHYRNQTSERAPWRTGRLVSTGVVLGSLAVGVSGVAISGAAASHRVARLTISTLATKNFGTILTSTRTVYTLRPSKVACTATCHTYWPEVLLPKGATRAIAGRGVNAAKLGTIARPGGRRQVTYAGQALYWFFGDTAPGQVKGNVTDAWGKWSSVVLIKPSHSSSTPTSSTKGTTSGW